MFLRIEQPDSSRESSDGDTSPTHEQTLLRKAKSDKDLFARKSKAQPPEFRFQNSKEPPTRERHPSQEQPRRNNRTETDSSVMEAIESVLFDAARSINQLYPHKMPEHEPNHETESAMSRSCIESLKDSLILQGKKRKDLQFSLMLKDKMIAQLRLQNELYEKISNHSPRHSNLTTVPEKELVMPALELKKPGAKKSNLDVSERKTHEKMPAVTARTLANEKRPRETDMVPKRHEPVVSKHHDQNPVTAQNTRYKKLVKNFGQAISKMARKQVARDGKQSKDLRQLWDVWNRLVRDLA